MFRALAPRFEHTFCQFLGLGVPGLGFEGLRHRVDGLGPGLGFGFAG